MNEQDLIENLGTIAKSGTKNFLSKLSGDKKKDSALIGQFGVGFYSAFMVASKIIVTTKKAGEAQGYAWISDGSGEFEIEKCEKEGQGSEIKLYLKDDEKEFTSRWRIEEISKNTPTTFLSRFSCTIQRQKVRVKGILKKKSKKRNVSKSIRLPHFGEWQKKI